MNYPSISTTPSASRDADLLASMSIEERLDEVFMRIRAVVRALDLVDAGEITAAEVVPHARVLCANAIWLLGREAA